MKAKLTVEQAFDFLRHAETSQFTTRRQNYDAGYVGDEMTKAAKTCAEIIGKAALNTLNETEKDV